jgi:L-lactate dehydrogenase complex protein LldF
MCARDQRDAGLAGPARGRAALKERVLRHLDTYLLDLEASVQQAGGHVHWARDAQEASAIVTQLVEEHGARQVIKVKSLTTDEIKLNRALEARGIEAIETDLAELIIQLAGESSSHILVPAIHKNRAEIDIVSFSKDQD